MPVPRRIERAVALVDPRPGRRVLEVGCGPGVAAGLVCGRLEDGHLLAIDRSDHAVATARERNAAHVRAGRLAVERATLAELVVDQPFDAAFAVNVNVFWTSDAAPECAALVDALAPGAPVHLVYDRPEHLDAVAATLDRHGFLVERHPDAVTGRRS